MLDRASRAEGNGGCSCWSPSVGRRWCERTETVLVEEEVTPRQEDLVPCASLQHYQRRGWRLDLTWSGHAGLCAVYK